MTLTYPQTTDMLTIEPTYCGPPDSAHGGVAVGRFASLVPSGPVEVRLLGPPPLGTRMASRMEDDGTVVVTGPAGEVARARTFADPLEVAPFRLVDDDEVDAVAEATLETARRDGHPFPTCVACGPDRHDPDALRQFTGAAADGDTVGRFCVPGEGFLPDWLTLAGLDCPSGGTVWALAEDPPPAAVLGAMRCELRRPARAGVDHQVRGRLVSVDGRKLTSEVAMLDPEASVVAIAQALWIAVDPTLFGGATTEASA